MLCEELNKLKHFFKNHPSVSLCFSGGVDSAFLLYFGLHSNARIKAYYVKSDFQPRLELNDVLNLSMQLGVRLTILTADILSQPLVVKNGYDRCYHCKSQLLSVIKKQADLDGFPLLIDGTNASDEGHEPCRLQALAEFDVRSPLREFGIDKSKVRLLSRKAGLFTWNKPAYDCLAKQIPFGTPITYETLKLTEYVERELMAAGFTGFKVMVKGRTAKLQMPASQMDRALEKRERIMERLKPELDTFLLDLAGL